MTAPWVIFDANVWLSFLFWPGPTIVAAVRAARSQCEIVASEATLDELAAKLIAPKFDQLGVHAEDRRAFLADVHALATLVPVTVRIKESRDPYDDMYLELAASCRADFIVTGDRDLLALHPWRGTAILRPADFVALMQKGDGSLGA